MTGVTETSSHEEPAEHLPAQEESLVAADAADAAETACALDEDVQTELPAYVAPSEATPRARTTIAIGPFRVRPAVLAWAVSIAVHVAVAAASLMVISWQALHARGIDVPGWGDGATETGMIETPGQPGGASGLMAQALPDGPAPAVDAPPGLPNPSETDSAEPVVAQVTPEVTPSDDDDEDDPVAQPGVSASALQGLASLATPHPPPAAFTSSTAAAGESPSKGSDGSGNAPASGASPGTGTATPGSSAGTADTGPGRTGDGGLAFSGRPGTPDGVRGRRGLARPTYPVESRRRGEQGTVVLEVEVLPDGTVGHVRVAADPGYPRLVDAAVAQVRREHFTPLIEEGRAVPYRLTIPYDFRLR